MSNQRYVLRTDTRYLSLVGAAHDGSADSDVLDLAASATAIGVDTRGCNLATLMPFGFDDAFGAGAIDETFDFSVWGLNSNPDEGVWYPAYIAKFTATLGTTQGIVNGPAVAGCYFADKIELVDGDTSCRIISPENNNIASVTIDLAGAQRMYVGFSDGSGSQPDNFNCLYGLI
jgi:hypothetical protein